MTKPLYQINDDISFKDLSEYVGSLPKEEVSIGSYTMNTPDYRFKISPKYMDKVRNLISYDDMNSIIYGKDTTKKVVNLEVVGDEIWLFKADGSIEKRPFKYWLLTTRPLPDAKKLKGNLAYKYITEFDSLEEYKNMKNLCYKNRIPLYGLSNLQEMAMISEGVTLFKDMRPDEVSVLSFDIEATGLVHNSKSKTLMISNTFRDKDGNTIKKHFRVDHYGDTYNSKGHDKQMIADWCEWVRQVDPDIIVGHNILGYDLPYLQHCGGDLCLGRDDSFLEFADKPKQKRVDGSQTWTYYDAHIFGRQIVDTSFLAVAYDFKRAYPSWKLKDIIEYEGLVKKGRQFYDASNIGKDWYNPEKRELIVQYGIDDGDDSLALFDLMIPSFFYYTQNIPKTLQSINNSATGSQINAFLVRAYLQDGHSIPMASEGAEYEGAISFGNPGIWDHVNKVDVASLYPSIMIEYKIHDPAKDPNKIFLKMVNHFTKDRLENKRLGRETGERYYKDLEQSQKIFINSAYGLLGASGLHFNSPKNAALVTSTGREILQKGIEWACGHKMEQYEEKKGSEVVKKWKMAPKTSEGKGFQLVNVDTDSFSFTTGKRLDKEDFQTLIDELNTLYPNTIVWEDDDQFKRFIVVKAKNYCMIPYKAKEKVTIKGSALKATTKELALKEFIGKCLELFALKRKDRIYELYLEYVKEIKSLNEITRWSSKKTVTKSVLNPKRTNEQKVLDAIGDKPVQEGDKIRVYFDIDGNLKLEEDFKGDHSSAVLLEKLYNTLKVFSTIIDIDCYPNYYLARNKDMLDSI